MRKGLDVIAMSVGLQNARHLGAVGGSQNRLGVEAAVDDQRFMGLGALDHVNVVLHVPDFDLPYDEVGALVVVRHRLPFRPGLRAYHPMTVAGAPATETSVP